MVPKIDSGSHFEQIKRIVIFVALVGVANILVTPRLLYWSSYVLLCTTLGSLIRGWMPFYRFWGVGGIIKKELLFCMYDKKKIQNKSPLAGALCFVRFTNLLTPDLHRCPL